MVSVIEEGILRGKTYIIVGDCSRLREMLDTVDLEIILREGEKRP